MVGLFEVTVRPYWRIIAGGLAIWMVTLQMGSRFGSAREQEERDCRSAGL
jgi:hypothetical protein